MTLMEKIEALDRRIIYLLAWAFVLFPLLNPLGLPIPISQDSRAWYDYIDAIPDGSTILFSMDYGVSGMPELFPMTVATMAHLWSRDVKVVVIAFWSQGPLVFNTLLTQLNPEDFGKVYGEDWVELGYMPGGETAMNALASDIHAAFTRDFLENRPISEFPIMQDIRTAQDIDLIVSMETGTPGLAEWLRQWQAPHGVPIIVGCIGVSVPGMIPYLNSGQLSALMPGLTTSAEYEVLLGRPGLAVAGVDAVSTSHLMLVLLVIMGNIAYFASRGRRRY